MKKILYIFLFGIIGCRPNVTDVCVCDSFPSIYPDYIGVEIPLNVAPLNFLMRDTVDAMRVIVRGQSDSLVVYGDDRIEFPMAAWKSLLQSSSNKILIVEVSARKEGKWMSYRPFEWLVSADSMDAYISYRLIEPGYEVWHALQLRERCIENFDERVIADNNLLGMSCMNCHIYGNKRGDLSMFHLRGEKGGTILNRDGKLRKLSLKVEGMISGAVYGDFHPSGRWGVFSTNIIIPGFHSQGNRRLEVYDTKSDIVMVDFDHNTIQQPALLNGDASLETFPCFSADGKRVFFCTAPCFEQPDSIQYVKYSLCSVSFDEKNGIGNDVDTLVNARNSKTSVCHLKTSPNGRWLIYTEADFGTFPIWHRETNLRMIDLQTRKIDSMNAVSSNRSETYHSWSSNSRWLVFASKRGDGQYGKPYFCHIDSLGQSSKPFLLPQQNPYFYDETLKSFNIPDFSKTPLPYNAMDIERIYKNTPIEKFTKF